MRLDEHGTVKGRPKFNCVILLGSTEYYDDYAVGQHGTKTLRLVVVRSTVRYRYWGTGSVDVVEATQGL